MLREADAGAGDVARLVDAGRDQDGVVARAQLGEAGVAADLEIEMEADAAIGEQLVAARDDLLLQLEVGDAVDQQAADPVVAVVDV